MEPIDPALYERADLRAALADHRFGPVFDALNTEAGLSYREIGRRTDTHESVIDAIRKGRTVERYNVLVRLADGLLIPRHLAGLGYNPPSETYPEQVTVADSEGAEKMLRRHLLAQGGITIAGATVAGLGELLAALPELAPTPLPSRLDTAHVVRVQNLTRSLRDAGRAYGSDPEMSSAATAWATRLLGVPGAEPVTRSLLVAVAELHAVAGWAAFDAGLFARTMWHYAQALELARRAGDPYWEATALAFAGMATAERGHGGDGLKMLQSAQVRAWDIPRDHDRRAVVSSMISGESAIVLDSLEERAAADAELAKAHELWRPGSAYGDPNAVAARIEVGRNRLNTAEPFAAVSVRRWNGGTSRRAHAQACTVLATIHTRAGEHSGVLLAHKAITSVGKLSSARIRAQLHPLADALATRPGADARELARMARQVATTRV